MSLPDFFAEHRLHQGGPRHLGPAGWTCDGCGARFTPPDFLEARAGLENVIARIHRAQSYLDRGETDEVQDELRKATEWIEKTVAVAKGLRMKKET